MNYQCKNSVKSLQPGNWYVSVTVLYIQYCLLGSDSSCEGYYSSRNHSPESNRSVSSEES